MAATEIVDLDAIFEGDFTLQKYSQLRFAVQGNEANANALEERVGTMEGEGPQESLKLGIAQLLLGRTQRAIALFKVAHPESEIASIFLGKANLDLDRPQEAKLAYREALVKHKDSRPIAYGVVFATLRLGDYEESLEILDRAEERFGADVETRFLRGFHSELLGDYAVAREAYEEVIEKIPQHPHALFRLAH